MTEQYIPVGWENKPSIKTKLNADNLNHMDEAIAHLYSDKVWTDYPVNLMGDWTSMIDFGGMAIGLPTMTARDGSVIVSGFIGGADPWDANNVEVLQIPDDCLPSRVVFGMGNTNNGIVILAIDPVSKTMKILYMAGTDPVENMGSEGLIFQFTYALLGE